MAEVFGLVAGAIGIAPIVLELAKSVKKLKDFYHDAKNAPEAVQDLVDDIDDMSSILIQLAARNLHDTADEEQVLRQCLTHCARANARISTVVTELQSGFIAHKSRASITYPLHKARLKKLTQKLERGKTSLSLACQVYSIAVAQAQFTDTGRRFQDLEALLQTQGAIQDQSFRALSSGQALLLHSARSIPQPFTDVVVSKRGAMVSRRSPKDSDNESRCVKSQVSWIWNVCTEKATPGWSYLFRTYRVLTLDHPGVQACEHGDLQGLQCLLCSHQLSINDRTETGYSLFIVSQVRIALRESVIGRRHWWQTDHLPNSNFR